LSFLLYICIFAIGWFSHTLFIYIFNLGSSVILLKRVLAETLLFIANLVQDIYELQELKRYELEKTGKSEKQLELQKRIDEKEINIFKRKVVKTIKTNFPSSFSHLINFDDWDTLLKSIEQHVKKGG
jgi:hypothetical protein